MQSERVFVLRCSKYGESDLVVHCLNSEGEKLSLFARAALKSKKRFGGGVLEPTHFIEANFKESRREEGMGSLQEARIVNAFPGIRTDYDKLQLALHMVSVVDHFCQEGLADNSSVFNLLGNGLKALETSESLENLKILFELKLLRYQGILQETGEITRVVETPIAAHHDLEISKAQHLHLRQAVKNYML